MTYTLSADFFDEIDWTTFSDILFPFTATQRPNVRMAVDMHKIIINRYEEVLDAQYQDLFMHWLFLMNTHKQTSFSVIDVDLNNVPKNEYCLKLASSVRGERKLIVKSLQKFLFPPQDDDCVYYDGHRIPIIERHLAGQEINNPRNVINVSIIDSQEVEVNINSNNTNYE